jgi:hypothetical protein
MWGVSNPALRVVMFSSDAQNLAAKDDTIFMPHVVYECRTCMMDETEG